VTPKVDPVAALEKRVTILENAISQGTGVSLAEFDPEAVAAKQKAEADAAADQAKADQAARDAAEARVKAEQEAKAAEEAKIAARAKAILEQTSK
jgi:membrane protein involved in colicin uptake